MSAVPPLASSTPAGKPYERSAAVQAEILQMLSLPQSVWIAKAKELLNETLVFLIRQTFSFNDEVCGRLLEKLRKRIGARVRRSVRGLDQIAAEEVLMKVEMDILEGVLTQESSRRTDFLEIAFAHAVDNSTADALRKLNNSPAAHRVEFIDDSSDEYPHESAMPVEYLLDPRPNPEETLLQREAEDEQRKFIETLLDAVENARHREAIRLHFLEEVPIESSRPGARCLTRDFRVTARQVKHWISTGLAQMRAAAKTRKNPSDP